MKTLTVAELRYMLAQLPPEFDGKPVISSVEGTLEERNVVAATIKPKFSLRQSVTVSQTDGEVLWASHAAHISGISIDADGKPRYNVDWPGTGCAMGISEDRITAVTKSKFKEGDRVYLTCSGHYHHKQTGTIICVFEGSGCQVRFDGHDCEHLITGDTLTLVKFAKGQRVKCEPTYRLAHYAKLEVVGVLGKTGEHLVYQLKATRVGGGEETVSASGKALSVVEEDVPMIPKCHYNEAIRWAEGLILQLPQNHGGRNSWLMNYGSVDKEVLTDPEAVATLLHAKAVIYMTTENGTTLQMSPGLETENVKVCMKAGATFTWHRKEKRKD